MVCENEEGQSELGFCHADVAERFVAGACMVGKAFQKNENRVSMSLLGDILKASLRSGIFTMEELYRITEDEAIGKLRSAPDERIRRVWSEYERLDRVRGGDRQPVGRYFASVNTKRRYINPLVREGASYCRIADISESAKTMIADLLAYEDLHYGYVDFDF